MGFGHNRVLSLPDGVANILKPISTKATAPTQSAFSRSCLGDLSQASRSSRWAISALHVARPRQHRGLPAVLRLRA